MPDLTFKTITGKQPDGQSVEQSKNVVQEKSIEKAFDPETPVKIFEKASGMPYPVAYFGVEHLYRTDKETAGKLREIESFLYDKRGVKTVGAMKYILDKIAKKSYAHDSDTMERIESIYIYVKALEKRDRGN